MRRTQVGRWAGTVAAVVAAMGLVGCVPDVPPDPVAGSTGGGDPYFPASGNGGYDVDHYDLTIDYEPTTRDFEATAVVRARTTDVLSSFSLDLRDLTVDSVTVNGRPAQFVHDDGELVVTPAYSLASGGEFTTTVVYGGTTGQPVDGTGSLYGWVSFDDGAFVGNEPEGASTWYPVNDVPTDKATYRFTVVVPDGTAAIANGDLVSQTSAGGLSTFVWQADDPMASYLSMVATGDYVITSGTTPAGLPIVNAVDEDFSPADQAEIADVLALQPEMIEFFEGHFGPYPFSSYGAVVDDDEDPGYALENQTRPIYAGVPDETTVAHELAHQWYGNKVTLRQWKDIWLNEGFATYAEWMWAEHRGIDTIEANYDFVQSINPASGFWTTNLTDPSPARLFVAAIYLRGGAFLHALRLTIGDPAFEALLQQWAAIPPTQPVSTPDLLVLAESVSGMDLNALFTDWLVDTDKPAFP